LFGPLFGAAILTMIEEGSRILFGGSGRGTDLIIYAALIVLIAIYYPNGVTGCLRSFLGRRKAVRLAAETGEAR
jgi:branched-chain amino acid transport system permease protein